MTATVAVRVPVAAGLKVMLMVQVPSPATLEPQVLDWAKSPASAPEIAMPVMVKALVDELARVMV